ncbi:transglycosylase, partial [Methylobacterium sp. WL103]
MALRRLPRPTAAFRAAVALVSGIAPATAEPLRVGNAVLEPVELAALPGWQADETRAAFEAFRRTCA